MKKILKASIVFAVSVMMTVVNCMPVVAADSDYGYSESFYKYYDVKKAGDYVLNYCDADYRDPKHPEAGGLPEGRVQKINDTFYFNNGRGDCTNFVSQALYYGGYEMRGCPLTWWRSSGCNGHSRGDWFYYKLKDNFEVSNDMYSSSWNSVESARLKEVDTSDRGIKAYAECIRAGLFEYLAIDPYCNADRNSNGDPRIEYECPYFSDLTYEEVIKLDEKTLSRGDVMQIDLDGNGSYDHSTFVWCTQPEIRLTFHTINFFAKTLRLINSNIPEARYRVIHTTHHADPTKNKW